MGRRRDHRPRFDATVCPDPAGCARLYHPELEYDDPCECCGGIVSEDRHNPPPVALLVAPAVDYSWADNPAVLRAMDREVIARPFTDHTPAPAMDVATTPEPSEDDGTEVLGYLLAEAEAALAALADEVPRSLDALADLQDTSVLDLIAWCQNQRRALTELERTVTEYAGRNLRVPRNGTMADGRSFQVLKAQDRTQWQHDEWKRAARHAVVQAGVPQGLQVIDPETGEVAETARHLAQRITAAVQEVHGAGAPRTGSLRALGINPDEYCTTAPGAWTVRFSDPIPTTED